MSLTTLLTTSDANEAELVRAMLAGQGLHPFVQGGNSGALLAAGFAGLIELRVLVPAEELAQAEAFLAASRVLSGTESTGEALEGAVCPVHEQPAVATCGRCGTFLCASCGSLGNPPLCEDCVARPEESKDHAPVMRAVARGYVALYLIGLGLAALASAGYLVSWLLR